MFDIGATELLVVAVVTILVVGPKDLPGVLRNFANFAGKARRMANDFQSQFNQALREAERESGLEDTTRQIREATDIRKNIGIKTSSDSEVPNGGAAKEASKIKRISDDDDVPDNEADRGTVAVDERPSAKPAETSEASSEPSAERTAS